MVLFMKVAKPKPEGDQEPELEKKGLLRKRLSRKRKKKTSKTDSCGYQSSSENSSSSRERVLRKRMSVIVYEKTKSCPTIQVSPDERIESNFNELSSTTMTSDSMASDEKSSTEGSYSSSPSIDSSSSTKKRTRKSIKNKTPTQQNKDCSNCFKSLLNNFFLIFFFGRKTVNTQVKSKRRMKSGKPNTSQVQEIKHLSPSLLLPFFVTLFIFISIFLISRILNYSNLIL